MTTSDRFRALHRPGQPLALANAWDIASACLIEQAGAAAIATTSAGVAWALGAADGGGLDRDRALRHVAAIVRAVTVPVTADIEDGYATDADGVAETIAGVRDAGAVGVNLEDAWHEGAAPLRPIDDAAARVAAAHRAGGSDVFINARVDTYLRAVGEPSGRFDETVRRAQAYIAAGADGIFVPGVVDTATVAALVSAVGAPVNVLAGPGDPSVAEFAKVGVARISLGSSVAAAAYAVARRAAAELLASGTYGAAADGVSYGEMNALFTR
jgi:2-methylisocitrate lyase-like PEP mutase family enzyme